MKQVELSQVRAMLREVVATSGNNGSDVMAIMAIGTEEETPQTSIAEVNDLLNVLDRALPKSDGLTVSLGDAEWRRFEDLYYQRVTRLVLA